MSGTPKVQHYVPQFLLRNFGSGKKDRICVFDKLTGEVFITRARNVAAESRFYDFAFEGEAFTIEPSLQKLEDFAKPIIERLLKADDLGVLSDDDRAALSIFLAIQFTRTRWHREHWRFLIEEVGKRVRGMVSGEGELSAVGLAPVS